ncbi:MAG: hypothetical protein Q8Q49_02570 [bacterium]|nr:hypothetical protein [bacterium]
MKTKIPNIVAPALIILVAVALRLLPHPPNVAPIAAMALFGGVYLDKRLAIVLPLTAMLVSDLFLGFHDTMLFVYSSFVLTGFLGIWLRKHKKPGVVLAVSFLSSLLFYIITNFGVWIMGSMYPKTFVGLLESYFFALPFFRNTIVGDLLYTGLFFGGYELLTLFFFRHAKKAQALKRE